jgi:hypothetical protein
LHLFKRSGICYPNHPSTFKIVDTAEEEQMLVQALTGPGALDGGNAGGSAGGFPDFGTMSEEDQIAYAIQMSMQEAGE